MKERKNLSISQMNVVNSVKEGFGNVDRKWNSMTPSEKASMLIGIISGVLLLMLVLLKVFGVQKLGANNWLPAVFNGMGANAFVGTIAVLLIVTGGLNAKKLV